MIPRWGKPNGLDDDSCGHDARYRTTLYLPKDDHGCIACAYQSAHDKVATLEKQLEGARRTHSALCKTITALQRTIHRLEKLLIKARMTNSEGKKERIGA